MRNNNISLHSGIIVTFLMYILLIVNMLCGEVTWKNYIAAGLWIALVAALNYGLCVIYKKLTSNNYKLLIIAILFVILIGITTAVTMRISAAFVGSEKAWENKWSYLVVLCFLSGGWLFSYITISALKKNNQKIINELAFKQQELDLLKMQMNPHFLFNTLNNLAATIMVDREISLDYTYKLSELLRFRENISKRETIEIQEEVSMIQSFLDIEKLRLGARCNIVFTQDIADASAKIPSLLLYPLVEAAIKRSKNHHLKPSVDVTIVANKAKISLLIKNTISPDMDAKKVENECFQLINKRLNALFPGKNLLKFEERDHVQTTRMEIKL
ncbi:histidine kinase [Paludibacter sp.]|uniref:sensor histidine kinase n=1 Tax=Paludibacter sp. TaxID=1898105 RepID=UPI001352835D|nr:histidine kinase [Paludibacter sp.]MTK53767.1 hypothetical protein [Paludibacter sp.]